MRQVNSRKGATLARPATKLPYIIGGNNMILTDIIALAKAGYSPADVKDLIALQSDENKDLSPSSAPLLTPDAEPEPELSPAPEGAPETPADDKETKIYDMEAHAKIKELEAQNKALSEQISKLQHEETRKDISGGVKSDQDKFNELMASFM